VLAAEIDFREWTGSERSENTVGSTGFFATPSSGRSSGDGRCGVEKRDIGSRSTGDGGARPCVGA